MKRFTLSNLKQVFELLLGKIAEVTTAFQSTVDEIYENIEQLEESEVRTDSADVGGSAHPVYLSDNTIKACTSTVGGDTHPVYMSVGSITTCAGTVGDNVTPMYLKDGVFTAIDYEDVTEEDIDAIFD